MSWLWTWLGATAVVGGLALAIGLSGGGGEQELQVREVSTGQDPRVLVVTYVGPSEPCEAPTRVTVDESDDTVTLRAWAEEGPDGVCPALGRLLTAEVELDEELGDRDVVDGRNGQAVVVRGSPG